MGWRLSVSILFSILPGFCLAGPEDGGSAGAFLRVGVGARAVGMGEAFVSVADDGSAGFWNPAGLVQLKGREVIESYRSLSLGRKQNLLGYSQSVEPGGGFGLLWIFAGAGEIDQRDINGHKIGKLSDSENAFYFSFARKLGEKASVGLNIKYLYHRLAGETGQGFGLDLGFLVRLTDSLSLGFVAKDLNSKLSWRVKVEDREAWTENDLPWTLIWGVSYRLFSGHLLLSADLERNAKEGTNLNLGWEFEIDQALKVRAGVNRLDDMGMSTAAFGMTIQPVLDRNLKFQYAYTADELGAGPAHVLSATIGF